MAGTIFDRTRTPLTVWFTACWLFATAKGRDLGAEPAVDEIGLAEILGKERELFAMSHSPLTAPYPAHVMRIAQPSRTGQAVACRSTGGEQR